MLLQNPPSHPQGLKLLHHANSTFEISKFPFTTSFSSSWAWTRISPRHSNSSFMLQEIASTVVPTATGSKPLPDRASFPSSSVFISVLGLGFFCFVLFFCRGHHFYSSHSIKQFVIHWCEAKDCSCPFETWQSHLSLDLLSGLKFPKTYTQEK